VAGLAARWLGPTASALVRFSSGAAAAAADRLSAGTVERVLRTRAHPGLLVPHAHDAAVLAVDMRGFSQLTLALDDTPYLAGLLGADAEAGTVLIDRGSFERAGFEPLHARTVRLRSRKLRRRLEAVCLCYGDRGAQRPLTSLPTARLDSPAESP